MLGTFPSSRRGEGPEVILQKQTFELPLLGATAQLTGKEAKLMKLYQTVVPFLSTQEKLTRIIIEQQPIQQTCYLIDPDVLDQPCLQSLKLDSLFEPHFSRPQPGQRLTISYTQAAAGIAVCIEKT